MSKSDTNDTAMNEYQVAVWAEKEYVETVDAENADEAEGQASEFVEHEHGATVLEANHEGQSDGEHQVQVWARKEYIVTEDAASEEQAKSDAKEDVREEYGVSTINSARVEGSW